MDLKTADTKDPKNTLEEEHAIPISNDIKESESKATPSTQAPSPVITHTKRQKGVMLYRPIVYGNTATLIKKPENENTHNWVVYVRGLNNEDLSYYISKVEYKLHESFAEPIRVVDKWPYELHEKGWGEFEIIIKVHFVDPLEKVLTLSHFLRLYPLDDPFQIVHSSKSGTVITEQYDEIVFHDPTVMMYNILKKKEFELISLKSFENGSPYDKALKEEENRIEECKKKVLAELDVNQHKASFLNKKFKH